MVRLRHPSSRIIYQLGALHISAAAPCRRGDAQPPNAAKRSNAPFFIKPAYFVHNFIREFNGAFIFARNTYLLKQVDAAKATELPPLT